MPGASRPPLQFGRLSVRPAQREVLLDDRPVAIGARALDVLLTLIEHRDRVVGKDELLAAAWQGLVVEDNNLQVQISALRKMFGSNLIATVPARGYRFTLPETGADPVETAAPHAAHGLPAQPTRFIGRAEDLAALGPMLGQTRLLTLSGIGGCGKTRLALELAEQALPSFANGVRYADLAALQDPQRVELAVAAVLGVRAEERDAPLIDRLCRHLQPQQCLLVLDNCEHLTAACAALVQRLVAAAPRLTVLAASREGLGLPGERLFAVRSLSFPAPSAAGPGTDEALQYESVQLFVERAQAFVPSFKLDRNNAAGVTEICRRLDGIPLAIELAAARINVLSVEEIRARLNDRFRLLTGGRGAAMGRQQTLRAAIQWSHDHLDSDERKVLRRLAVFSGGWTLEAALTVASDNGDEYGMLDALARLAHYSLVVTQPNADEPATRYTMLETVRQYAMEQLDGAGETGATRDRHMTYFVRLAHASERGLFGAEHAQWYARLKKDFENLLGACDWGVHSANGVQASLELLADLRPFLSESGQHSLGEQLLAQALGQPAAQAPNLARCRALAAWGVQLFFLGRYQESLARGTDSLDIAIAVGDISRQAYALWIVAFCEFALGNPTQARATFERALALARSSGDETLVARALLGLAEVARSQGELERALALNEETLQLHRAQQDLSSMVVTLANLTMTAVGLRRTEQACAYLMQAIELADKMSTVRPRIPQLFCAAGIAVALHDWARAGRYHGAMLALAEPMNYHLEPADSIFVTAVVEEAVEALGHDAFAEAVAVGQNLSVEHAIADVRDWLRANRSSGSSGANEIV